MMMAVVTFVSLMVHMLLYPSATCTTRRLRARFFSYRSALFTLVC